jgi:hypothetical protein
MCTQPTKKPIHGLGLAAIVMALVGVFIAPTAFARITANTIDPVASLADSGQHLRVTGPMSCTPRETASLRVTVTQRATGAVAEGQTRITCTGAPQQWEIQATTHGQATFQEGPATAGAFARTTTSGETTDAHQWLVDITLVGE